MTDEFDEDALAGLKELMGDDFAKLVETYIKSSSKHVDTIFEGLEEKNAKKIEDAAHPLKSSSGNMAMIKLSKFSERVELTARAIGLDTADFDDLELDNLRELYSNAEEKLRAEA